MQYFIRVDGAYPAHFVYTWRSQANGLVDQLIDQQAHEKRDRMPSAGDQSAKERLFGAFRVRVKRLGVKLARKGDDFLLRGRSSAQVKGISSWKSFKLSVLVF